MENKQNVEKVLNMKVERKNGSISVQSEGRAFDLLAMSAAAVYQTSLVTKLPLDVVKGIVATIMDNMLSEKDAKAMHIGNKRTKSVNDAIENLFKALMED